MPYGGWIHIKGNTEVVDASCIVRQKNNAILVDTETQPISNWSIGHAPPKTVWANRRNEFCALTEVMTRASEDDERVIAQSEEPPVITRTSNRCSWFYPPGSTSLSPLQERESYETLLGRVKHWLHRLAVADHYMAKYAFKWSLCNRVE